MGLGIKVSLPGNDADSGDVNLAFNSQWPALREVKAGEIRGSTSETFTTIPHGQDFVPMMLTWGKDSGYLNMPRQNIFIDNTNIYWSHPGIGSQLDETSIMIFDVDIEKPFKAPAINLRFTKEGKDASSRDLRDYIIHSSARTPLLHEVFVGTGNVTYAHDLPYSPIFLVFAQTTLLGAPGTPYVLLNNFAGVTTDGKTISVTGLTAGGKVSIVILKDPFNIDNAVSVTI
jgi:hypothetical protein